MPSCTGLLIRHISLTFYGTRWEDGTGWQTRDLVRHAQDFDRNGNRDLNARDPGNGDLRFYGGNGSGGFSGQYVNGTGWGIFSEIAAPGDWNGDGNPDLIAIRPNGVMNLYPGNGSGGFGGPYPQIGSGWQTRDQIISVGDWDGDGRNDLIAREPANGDLWLYSGNGRGGFIGQRVIGVGWGVFDTLVGPGDWDGNGTSDILARRPNGDLHLFAGDGRGGLTGNYPRVGDGWQSLRIVGAGQQRPLGGPDGCGRPDPRATRRDDTPPDMTEAPAWSDSYDLLAIGGGTGS